MAQKRDPHSGYTAKIGESPDVQILPIETRCECGHPLAHHRVHNPHACVCGCERFEVEHEKGQVQII